MSRHSLARALLLLFAALLVWSTVTSAEARPRRYANEVLADWTICRDGAEIEIGSSDPRVRLIATTPTSSGKQRELADETLELERRELKVWFEWELPQNEREVIDETPGDPPDAWSLDPGIISKFSAIVTVRWSRRAGSTVTLALGSVDPPSLRSATYRVRNCAFWPRKWTWGDGARTSWLWSFPTLPWPSVRG
jgi:hypothetical protein